MPSSEFEPGPSSPSRVAIRTELNWSFQEMDKENDLRREIIFWKDRETTKFCVETLVIPLRLKSKACWKESVFERNRRFTGKKVCLRQIEDLLGKKCV